MSKLKQYKLEPVVFDGYNKESGIQDALGSKRAGQRQEASSLKSTNYKAGESGWKITPSYILNTLYGTTVPSATPGYIGQMYIRTSTSKVYVATGLTSGDWQILN